MKQYAVYKMFLELEEEWRIIQVSQKMSQKDATDRAFELNQYKTKNTEYFIKEVYNV
jgi:hypothetical protein